MDTLVSPDKALHITHLCYTKVWYFEDCACGKQQVAGLDVFVYHMLAVEVFQTLNQLHKVPATSQQQKIDN